MGLKPRRRWAGEGAGGPIDRRFLREGADFCSVVAPTLHSSYPSATWTSKGLKQQYGELGGSESNHRMFVQLFQSAEKKSSLKNLALVEFLVQTEERSEGAFGAAGLPTLVAVPEVPGACVHVTVEWSVLVCCTSHLRSPSCHTITGLQMNHIYSSAHMILVFAFFNSTTGSVAQLSEGLPSQGSDRCWDVYFAVTTLNCPPSGSTGLKKTLPFLHTSENPDKSWSFIFLNYFSLQHLSARIKMLLERPSEEQWSNLLYRIIY